MPAGEWSQYSSRAEAVNPPESGVHHDSARALQVVSNQCGSLAAVKVSDYDPVEGTLHPVDMLSDPVDSDTLWSRYPDTDYFVYFGHS